MRFMTSSLTNGGIEVYLPSSEVGLEHVIVTDLALNYGLWQPSYLSPIRPIYGNQMEHTFATIYSPFPQFP